MGKNDGTELQIEIKELFDELIRKKMHVRLIRQYDTKSAGTFLPQTPGDFIIQWTGQAILLEAKSSEKYETLSQCPRGYITRGQIASHRLWNRAGGTSLFVFKSTALSVSSYECWDGGRVAWKLNNDDPLDICDDEFITSSSTLLHVLINLTIQEANSYYTRKILTF
jgi:hypothetical protein